MSAIAASLILMMSMPALAADAPKQAAAAKAAPKPKKIDTSPKKGSDSPVHITADTFDALPGDKQVIWKGNVVAVREDMRVTCNSLTADYVEQKKLKRLTCNGNVHMSQPASLPQHAEREAWGSLAVFENDSGLLTITGSPHGREGDNRMKGDKVFFDTTSDHLRAEGHVETWIETPPDKNPLAPAAPAAPKEPKK